MYTFRSSIAANEAVYLTRRLVQTHNRLCRAQHWDSARASAPAGMAALEHRYRVVDDGLAGLDRDPLHEGPDEGPGLGPLAGSQELAHVASERAGAVEEYTARKPAPPALPRRRLQPPGGSIRPPAIWGWRRRRWPADGCPTPFSKARSVLCCCRAWTRSGCRYSNQPLPMGPRCSSWTQRRGRTCSGICSAT